MFKPFFLYVGYKYVNSKRNNHFISFISLTSMFGIALGVAVLITVLSVMNGFNKEIKAKLLTFTPHVTLRSVNGSLQNWHELSQRLMATDGVVGVAPYIVSQGLLVDNGNVQPAVVHGVDPEVLGDANPLQSKMCHGGLTELQPGSFGIILGKDLAEHIGVGIGDKVTFLIPEASISIAGITPKFKRLTVQGLYDTKTRYDERNAFVNIIDAAKMFKMQGGVTGLQIQVRDEMLSANVAENINRQFEYKYWISDWTQDNANFFEALNMEKMVMWCILCLIIAVAAFNLVSSLVMMVTDKRSDIAILRTMGATPRSIMGIFIAQGTIIGVVGTLLGLSLGLVLASNITWIVGYIQDIFNVQFVSEDVYFVGGYVPSLISQFDVIVVCVFSLVMSFLATIYPAWRAANVAPAEALRYE